MSSLRIYPILKPLRIIDRTCAKSWKNVLKNADVTNLRAMRSRVP